MSRFNVQLIYSPLKIIQLVILDVMIWSVLEACVFELKFGTEKAWTCETTKDRAEPSIRKEALAVDIRLLCGIIQDMKLK